MENDDFGWLAFGGNIEDQANAIEVSITTAAKNKVFLQPESLWIELAAGKIASFRYLKDSGKVSVELESKDIYTPYAYVKVSEGWQMDFPKERGYYKIPLKEKPLEMEITRE